MPSPKAPRDALISVEFRNLEIDRAIKELEHLEGRFYDGDPVRNAIVAARRRIATHYIAVEDASVGLKVVK